MKTMIDGPCAASLGGPQPAPAPEGGAAGARTPPEPQAPTVIEFRRPAPERLVARFDGTLRVQHLFLMASFLGLAATGLPLLFSDTRWAAVLARMFGGFRAAGVLHRICAVVLIVVFLTHVARLLHRLFIRRDYSILWGPESMVPQPRDVGEMVQHVRWFVGLGPRPAFDHFTYWEKFDYWAVFWGMLIIGGSGLMLWFPVAFSRVVPGWAFNIALLIHGEEALLAVAFIFTIHFFNGHLRPEKFPMDTVIFTGCVPEGELRAERPAEYARLKELDAVDGLTTRGPAAWVRGAGQVVGTLALTAGVALFVLILYALST